MTATPTTASTSPRLGARIWRFPLTRIVLASLLTVLPVALTFAIVQAALEKSMRIMWPQLLAAGLCCGFYCLYVRYIEKRAVSEFALRGAGRELGAGILTGALLLAATLGALFALGAFQISDSASSWTVIIVPLAEVILVGLFEEILFRGVMFRMIENSLGSWIALILSGAIFALAHVPNAEVTLLAVGVTFVAGLMFAAAYMLTRRLWLCIGIHIGWNFILGDIFSATVSGHQSKGLFQAKLSGAEWLTGGAYGIEASAITLVVILVASWYLLLKAMRRGQFTLPFWKKSAGGPAHPAQDGRSLAAS